LLAALAALFYAVFWILPFPLLALPGAGAPWAPLVARVGPLFLISCGLAFAFGVYFLGYSGLRRDRGFIAPAALVGMPVLVGCAFLLTSPFTSTDIYYYVMAGRTWIDHGVDPAVVAPAAFPNDPVLPFLPRPEVTSPYGLFFTFFAAGLRLLVGPGVTENLIAHKAAAFMALLGVGLTVWVLFRRTAPERARLGLFLILWNPLLLWESAGAGHNEVLAILPVAVAFLAFTSRRWAPAALPLLVGASFVKYVPAILIPLALVWLARRAGRERSAWARFALGCASVLALVAGFWPQLRVELEVLAATRAQQTDLVGMSAGLLVVAGLLPLLGATGAWSAAYAVLLGGYALFYLYLMRRIWWDGARPEPAGLYAYLAFLVGPSFYFKPWYAIGPIVLAVLSRSRRLEMLAILFTLSASLFYPADTLSVRLLDRPAALLGLTAIAVGLTLGLPLVYLALSRGRGESQEIPAGP
jgi:hypothetical protein